MYWFVCPAAAGDAQLNHIPTMLDNWITDIQIQRRGIRGRKCWWRINAERNYALRHVSVLWCIIWFPRFKWRVWISASHACPRQIVTLGTFSALIEMDLTFVAFYRIRYSSNISIAGIKHCAIAKFHKIWCIFNFLVIDDISLAQNFLENIQWPRSLLILICPSVYSLLRRFKYSKALLTYWSDWIWDHSPFFITII